MAAERAHILFDLDGTLTDSREGIVRCFQHAFTQLQFSPPSTGEIHAQIGPPLEHGFAALLPDSSPQLILEAVRLYRERYRVAGQFENKLYPQIPELLELLRQRGHQLFVATSKPDEFARTILSHFGIAFHFTAIHGSHFDGRYSDKAELIGKLLTEEKISAETAIMVGDRKHDIIGAQRHNVSTIGVTYGFGSAEELRGAGATHLAHHPLEIADYAASTTT